MKSLKILTDQQIQELNVATGICSYSFINERGELKEKFNQICFFDFRSEKIKRARLYLFPYVNKLISNNKDALAYLDWVVKKSPFREAFLNRSLSQKKYIAEGLSLDTNKCPTFLVGAMTAVRQSWEYKSLHIAFAKYRKAGLSDHLSFIMSCLVHDNLIFMHHEGHKVFNGDFTISDIKNFKQENYFSLKKPARECATTYRGVHHLYRGKPLYEDSLYDILRDKFASKKGDGWKVREEVEAYSDKVINYLKELDNA